MANEEIFGPVLSVMTFRTPEEAFERANNIPYGLSAGVWTDKGSKIFKMVNNLLMQIARQADGNCRSSDYFSLP